MYLGDAQEVSLYHDGNNTYLNGGSGTGLMQIKNTGGGDVELYSNSNVKLRVNAGENAVVCNLNSSVDLYFDGGTYTTPKLKTSHYGITVDGEVASSQDYPNYRPTLDLNFASVKKLDSRITYSRTGAASYVDEKGIVKLVGDNVPRFNHDSVTRECKGLLLEETRTSLLTASTGNDSTSHYQQTDQGETITGPDGVENSAREYTANSNASTGGSTTVWANQAVGMANGISMSCFVKITRGTSMAFRLYDNNNALYSEKINLAGGVISDGSYATVSSTGGGTSSGTPGSTSWELYPNGWVRLKWEGTSHNANGTSYIQLYIYDHANSNGSNVGYAVWGFQVEAGHWCTSVIPKPTIAAATRESEYCFVDGEEFSDIYNQHQGTLVSEFSIHDTTTLTSGAIANINALSTNSYADSIMFMEIGTSSGYYGRVYKSSNGYSLTGNGNITTNGLMGGNNINKVSFAWSDTVVDEGLAAYRNGVLQNSIASEDRTPTNMTELRIGRGWSSSHINADIRRLSYYTKRLPDSQLATLTS